MVETVVRKSNPNIFMHRLPEWRFRKTVRYGNASSMMTHMFDEQAFLDHCRQYIGQLTHISARNPDPLAVVLRFVGERVSHIPGKIMTGMEAYHAYRQWAQGSGAEPMRGHIFAGNLRTFVDLACKDRVRNEPKVGARDNYVGLALV